MNPTSAQLWYRALRMVIFSFIMIGIVVFLLRSQRASQQRLKDSIASDQLYDSLKELVPNCNAVDCSGDMYMKSRRDQYCSKTTYPGAEGMRFHYHEHYELQNLLVMIRHGDRSSMHSLPNAKLIKFPSTTILKPEVLQFVKYLSQFTLNFLQSEEDIIPPANASQASKGEDLSHVFDSNTIFQETSDYLLPQGQLTSQGFFQHLQLGSILRQRYEEYFHKIHTPEQMYIRSTNYARTIRSASALLIGAFPHLFANKLNPIVINTFENEHNEIMHGIGVHHSSHNIPPSQSIGSNSSSAGGSASGATSKSTSKTSESVTLGGCTIANKYTKRQSDKFRRKIEVINQAIQLFGQEMVEYNPTEIVDAIVPIYCHGLPLPCSNKKAAQSLNTTTTAAATTTSSTPTATKPTVANQPKPSTKATTTTTMTASLPPGEGKDTDSGEEDHTVTGFLRSNNNARIESCIQLPYLEDIMMDADRMYCERFSGKEGGQAATNLAYYPLLQEIFERLLGPHNEHKPHDHKISVLSGHDTVIAPILSALGVYRSASLCYWPGYASRIVFELWKPISHSVHHIAKGEIIPYEEAIRIAGNYLTKSSPAKLKMAYHTVNITQLITQIEENRELFIRVVYNGKDITQLIPTCIHERIAIAKAIVDKSIQLVSKSLLSQLDSNFPLCSVISFKQQVQDMIAPFQSVADACRA